MLPDAARWQAQRSFQIRGFTVLPKPQEMVMLFSFTKKNKAAARQNSERKSKLRKKPSLAEKWEKKTCLLYYCIVTKAM